ncbi:MAG TPA: tripartite tricarboxylate transporter permease [Thermodesulfobacteriota bacterium]|nr:tripartite tricarboxylate transporter permease [Thermodesulfobacteriota bacterium]
MVQTAQSFLLGLTQIFTATTFGLMLFGIAIGFAVGILPGLGGPTAMALMLPFVVKMTPVEAFAFLLGMACVVNTTGDITSVLFGIPGEPTTAATIVDGHPMAKKGQAGRALGAVLTAALIGSIFGAFMLAIAVPLVRPLVLSFGSPEFFMLSLLGITFVASLSGTDIIKGLISGGLGLFVATVGLDPVSSIQRFTFGQTFLWDGIGLVPITIGFFAIPEIIDLAVTGSSIAGGRTESLGGVKEGVRDVFRHIWLVLRCAGIGTFCAIIPGMGGATTQWLSYAHAVQSSPDKERFGKGAIEGVLGPGASNNSTLGGSLITTISFGIPASVFMAILMGAFIMHGVVPGPDMLRPESQGGHLGLTYSFVWIVVVSNLITVGIIFLLLKQIVKVTYVRGSLITPFILMLIYLGAFAEKNAFPDLILVLIFGGLGWVLEKLKWPRPPLILGLVLGGLAESRLFLSVGNYGLSWIWRPTVLVLIAVTLSGALYPVFKGRKRKKLWMAESGETGAEIEAGTRATINRWAAVFALGLVLILALALWQSRNFNIRAGLFPWVIGFPLLGLLLLQFVRELRGKTAVRRRGGNIEEEDTELPAEVVNRRTRNMFGWILIYLLAIWLLGFAVGTSLCCFIQLKFASKEKWLMTLIMTAGLWAFVYLLFDRTLHVPFPAGYLFETLGIVE